RFRYGDVLAARCFSELNHHRARTREQVQVFNPAPDLRQRRGRTVQEVLLGPRQGGGSLAGVGGGQAGGGRVFESLNQRAEAAFELLWIETAAASRRSSCLGRAVDQVTAKPWVASVDVARVRHSRDQRDEA